MLILTAIAMVVRAEAAKAARMVKVATTVAVAVQVTVKAGPVPPANLLKAVMPVNMAATAMAVIEAATEMCQFPVDLVALSSRVSGDGRLKLDTPTDGKRASKAVDISFQIHATRPWLKGPPEILILAGYREPHGDRCRPFQ